MQSKRIKQVEHETRLDAGWLCIPKPSQQKASSMVKWTHLHGESGLIMLKQDDVTVSVTNWHLIGFCNLSNFNSIGWSPIRCLSTHNDRRPINRCITDWSTICLFKTKFLSVKDLNHWIFKVFYLMVSYGRETSLNIQGLNIPRIFSDSNLWWKEMESTSPWIVKSSLWENGACFSAGCSIGRH